MNTSTAIALFKLIVAVMAFFQEQGWYQKGRAAAYAEMDEEQRKRVALAEAARADADAFNSDPSRLTEDDGFRRD